MILLIVIVIIKSYPKKSRLPKLQYIAKIRMETNILTLQLISPMRKKRTNYHTYSRVWLVLTIRAQRTRKF